MTEAQSIDRTPKPDETAAVPVFSVVIVNYNGGAYVQAALDSLTRQTRRDFEVIVIDNASSDGSVDNLETSGLPAFTLLAETENHGYARGTNISVAQARGEWIVCLNPDAVADPAYLEQIASGIARNPAVNMFASAQYRMEMPSILDGAGDAYLIFGLPWRGGFGRPATEMPDEGESFSPCGAGAIFNRERFLRSGGFVEEFFCFCEDVELGFRMRLAGEKCVFLPGAVIHHVGGGLSGRASEFSTYHGNRNRIWTYARNMPSLLFWPTLPGHVVLSSYVLARSVLNGRFPATWRGMRDGMKGAMRMRKAGNDDRKHHASLWQLARAMAWNPFRMSQRRVHVRPIQKRPAAGSMSATNLNKTAL
ncbi:MAG: glycosyltransferase family 2 protein [Rhodobacterales bacterium]|nr:glycosyltransferase family 2 protein [Rhodobacterales bacterium]